MKCPDCRATVIQEPSPNYVVSISKRYAFEHSLTRLQLRDLVHMFIGRTELLPEDETTQEHEIAKAEEAVQMTTDRDGVGLFKGAFRNHGAHHQVIHGRARDYQGMWDPNDNVRRCPECHWELEGGPLQSLRLGNI